MMHEEASMYLMLVETSLPIIRLHSAGELLVPVCIVLTHIKQLNVPADHIHLPW